MRSSRRFPVVRPFLPLLTALLAGVGCGGGGGGTDQAAPGGAEPEVPAAEQGTFLHVVAPSVVRPNEELEVRLRVITQAGLPDYDFEGAFRLDASSPDAVFPEPMTIEPAQEGYYAARGLRLPSTGVQFLRGTVPGDTVQALANPINVASSPEYRIYWGDLNGHSDLSSGNRPAGLYYWYAKAVGLLDFAALTDNDVWEDRGVTDASFQDMVEFAMGDTEEAGRFVALPAFEWTSPEHGHRLVYLSEIPETLPTFSSGVDTPAKLRAAVPEGSVLALPHPSGSTENPAVDPSTIDGETLVEVYSSLGMFEKTGLHRASSAETAGSFVTDLLAAGHRPGFIASGDSRVGTPGNARTVMYGDHRYAGGLTAVLAPELTREAVLEALRARRCYATTGPRYLLEFAVDDSPMGSRLDVARGHVAKVYGALGSTTDWVRVEIVGPDGVVEVVTPEPGNDVVQIEAELPPAENPTWVYLRGVDEFGGMAWSSPVWILPG